MKVCEEMSLVVLKGPKSKAPFEFPFVFLGSLTVFDMFGIWF